MAHLTDDELMQRLDNRDKSLSWYRTNLENLSEPARELLEKYSGIPPERVIPHILEIRERAWEIWPYPCIGGFRFLELSMASTPVYPQVLRRLQDGAKLLDLGCCFAQEIRKLVADGAPSENLWGAELKAEFIDLGYELFLDRGRLKSHFITADVMDENSALNEIDGQMDIVYVGSFLHLFGLDGQVAIAKRIVKILKPQPGSMILGRQVGSKEPMEYRPADNARGRMFRHDPETFEKMWKDVGDMTGSKWKVTASLDFRQRSRESGETRDMMGHPEGIWRLLFQVERVE